MNQYPPYDKFLQNTARVVYEKVNTMHGRAESLAKQMADELFEQLGSDEAREAIYDALDSLGNVADQRHWPAGKGAAVRDLLLVEIRLFNVMHTEPNQLGQGDGDLDDAETVKGSIEELLSDWLPDWVKKNLNLLNELLSLLRF